MKKHYPRAKKKLFGGINFNYADLYDWCNKNSEEPDNTREHEPFVISYKIHVDQFNPKSNSIHIAISTRCLLLLAKRRKHICADATHKLNYKRKLINYQLSCS